MLVLMLVLFMTSAPVNQSAVADADSLDEIKVLMLVTTGFGWNYFDINETFVEWGAEVDTVSYTLGYEVQSCANREPQPIISDYLVSEMTDEILSEYDCIIVPSGGHWNGLYRSEPVLDLISSAYELGLVVSTICIGNVVVAESNNIVDGTKVAYYGTAWEYMTEAGGIPVYNARAVAHNNIVTGGTGGGYPSGFESAPTYEVCSEIVRIILRRSRVGGLILQPTTGSPSTNQSISVAITDPYEDLPGVNSTEVTKVEICIYHQENDTLALTVELSAPTYDNPMYVGEIVGLSVGEYYFDIEITDSEDRLEIADTFDSFTVQTDSITPPPIDSGLFPILGFGGISVLAVGVAFVLLKRRVGK